MHRATDGGTFPNGKVEGADGKSRPAHYAPRQEAPAHWADGGLKKPESREKDRIVSLGAPGGHPAIPPGMAAEGGGPGPAALATRSRARHLANPRESSRAIAPPPPTRGGRSTGGQWHPSRGRWRSGPPATHRHKRDPPGHLDKRPDPEGNQSAGRRASSRSGTDRHLATEGQEDPEGIEGTGARAGILAGWDPIRPGIQHCHRPAGRSGV